MRQSEDSKISKLGKYSFYMFIVYMMGMTGLYFHMDSRIKVQYTIITEALSLFKDYSSRNTSQQAEIDDVKQSIEELQDQVSDMEGNLNDKLTDLYRVLLSNKAYAAEPDDDDK